VSELSTPVTTVFIRTPSLPAQAADSTPTLLVRRGGVQPPSSDAGARAAQRLARLDDARGHAGLGGLAPRARVVDLLVADLAVDLQHAVVVAEDVICDRAGEGVLGVGVDVHLDDAVVDRRGDLLGRGPGAAVEDEVEGALLAVLRLDRLLGVLEHLRTELDAAGLVDTVDVAEGQRRQVAALLAQTESLDGREGVLRGAVELLVDLGLDAVLLATDDADLHLEDDVGGGGRGEQLLR